MKNIFLYIALATVTLAQAQKFDVAAKEILHLETIKYKDRFSNQPYTKTIIGDSILIASAIIKPEKSPEQLAAYLLMTKEITPEEKNEIFGNGIITFSVPPEIINWTPDYFPGFRIAFFDEDKYSSAVVLKNGGKTKSGKIALGTSNVLSMSFPLIREDGNYALIQVGSNFLGGILDVYRHTPAGWEFYKSYTLYYI